MALHGIDLGAGSSRSAEAWRHGPAPPQPGVESADPKTMASEILEWLAQRPDAAG
jgi:hypothetical protein